MARGRSHAGRSFDLVYQPRIRCRGTQPPCGPVDFHGMRRQVRTGHNRLAVIVIYTVVAVSMRGPSQVFFQTMRMTVLGDHLRMVLKNV